MVAYMACLGLACRPEQGVHAEIHVAHHIAQQDDDHILVGIDERLVAGSEEPKDGVEEEQTDDTQSDTDDEIKRYRVAQNVLRCGVVFLAQLHTDGS